MKKRKTPTLDVNLRKSFIWPYVSMDIFTFYFIDLIVKKLHESRINVPLIHRYLLNTNEDLSRNII